VMSEIVRVLRPGGYLYSELPFMQQVHEGAYDFTRYTLSGHRRLANRFEEIDSGPTAGPGTALGWAIEHFAASFFLSRRLQLIARAASRYLFFWLKHVDRLIADRPAALDAASCTYVLGQLRPDGTRPDAEIVDEYRGAGGVAHV